MVVITALCLFLLCVLLFLLGIELGKRFAQPLEAPAISLTSPAVPAMPSMPAVPALPAALTPAPAAAPITKP